MGRSALASILDAAPRARGCLVFPKIFRNTALGRIPTDSSSLNRAYPISTVSEAASGSDDERPRRKEQEIRTGNLGLIESSPVAR